MKNLFNQNDTTEILNRVDNLKPTSQPLWGKMEAAQMLAHCSKVLEMGTGQTNLPRIFIGKILGLLLKKTYSNEKPFKKNSPTDNYCKITGQRNFEAEKQKVKDFIQKFQTGGESKCATHPHPFFGKLTPPEWSIGMHKHLDHHLRQFGA
jgi:hypothetical protein